MGRHALIVGGARGIGAALAADLLRAGWRVTIAGPRTRPDALMEAGAAFEVLDASDEAACLDLLARIEPVDALVLAAGLYRRVGLLQETAEQWRGQFAANLDPVFHLARAVLPGMGERGWGRIVTFSMAGAEQLRANPFVAGHYIAKIGVLVLSRSLAKLAGPGVTVNCIPAGRLGTVDEASGVAAFLLSDGAAYVSGANILVSGGWGA
jgi:3-oxoacyl-[acyl-carrier protein] reductase